MKKFVSILLMTAFSLSGVWAQESRAPRMILPANMPQGEGYGIFPGRVVWAHAPGAASWDREKSTKWYADEFNDQAKCDWMVRTVLLELTGRENVSDSWNALFRDFNSRRDKAAPGYRPGEKIAVKVNQNNTGGKDDGHELNASPHLLLSLLNSLITEAGVPQEMITVSDPSRHITNALYEKCHAVYPGVVFVDNAGGEGRIKSEYVDNAIPYSVDNGRLATGLATCFVEADYVINMALLKGHVGQGVTLCGKNWYGVTSIHADWRKNAHNNFNQERDGTPRYMTFTDFMAHKDLGAKTVLFLVDGLLGSQFVSGPATGHWKMEPFNDTWPNTLLASQDGVAIDAVGFDILVAEYGTSLPDIDYGDAYLVEAANIGNPPSGTKYDPERDGIVSQGSLGVVEHWNNPTDRRYSRNLGKDEGIELIYRKM